MSSSLRIGGMASGLDTDALVKQMMQPYRMRVDKQKQDKQIMQWKQDIYRDIITDIRGLKDLYLDSIKPDNNLLMQKNYSGYDISNSNTTPANTTPAIATASVGAVAGNYILDVKGLAEGTKIKGTAVVTTLGTTVTNSTKLSDLNPTMGVGDKITLTVNGGTAIDITAADVASMTIQQFTDKINSATKGTVIARFSELTKSFSFETTSKGALTDLDISGGSGLLGTLTKTAGKDVNLEITPPGGVLTPITTKATNDFTIDGINYSLKGIGKTTLSVTENTDKAYEKILGFVAKYNELIDKIKQKIEQKKQYSYNPLTDEQKTSMKTEEIKSWEDKAKEGLIKGDNTLDSMLTSMRRAFVDPVGGVFVSLKDLGFTTSRDITQRGKIIIDERLTTEDAKKKFSDALKINGTQVADLFSKAGNDDKDYTGKGIFQRLDDIIESYSTPLGEKGILLKKAGIKGNTTEFKNFLSEQMLQKDKYISELTRKLGQKETSYYAMFTKLEKGMNTLNSQSSWLTQQMGGGQ